MSAGNERGFIDFLQAKEKGGRAMICPLFRAASIRDRFTTEWQGENCLKEECAWWDRRNSRCIKVSESYDLSYIRAALKAIEAKMPSGQSFVK